MKSCWEDNPDERPTFSNLVYLLHSVLNPSNTPGYVDFYEEPRSKEEDLRFM